MIRSHCETEEQSEPSKDNVEEDRDRSEKQMLFEANGGIHGSG